MNSDAIANKLKCLDCFLGVFPCDILPDVETLPAGLVINTHPSTKPGEHWIAIYIDKDGHGDYFDSYGNVPQHKSIISFLNINCPNGWNSNRITLQSVTGETCGQYCVLYLIMRSRGLSNQDYLRMFSRKSFLNDVTAWYLAI
jgi:hypothetical protein